MVEFCKLNKIELHFTTVNNPNSNSPVERFHSTILEKLRILKLKNPRDSPSNLMISAVLIYNQSIHSSTGFSPFYLLYGPYDRPIDFDLGLTVYEQYNEKRKQELMPFYDIVYGISKEKAQRVIDKRNLNKENPPDLLGRDVYVERTRTRKIDPPFQTLRVDKQTNGKVHGTTRKGRPTTAHIRKLKRLTKNVYSLQDHTDADRPSPLANDT